MPGDTSQSFRDLNEDDLSIHSFVLRIWLEEMKADPRQVVWRGHITYVNNGNRHYFDDLNEIPALIAHHLRETS